MDRVLRTDSYTVTPSAIVRYAGASGDFTPLHFDPDALAAAGYDRFFAMGMLVAGHLGALVARTFGDQTIEHFSVRFCERCYVGSKVTVELIGTDKHGQLTLRATAGDGTVIATGSARVDTATTASAAAHHRESEQPGVR